MILHDRPELQEFHLGGVNHIMPEAALEEVENHRAVMVDVREENEVRLEHIPVPNVLYHPMSAIINRVEHLPKDSLIILMCKDGVNSTKVANLLNRLGFAKVANLDGGLKVWKARNLPYASIFDDSEGCGCNCSSCHSANESGSCC